MSNARIALIGDRLSIKEMAEALHCSIKAIYRYMDEGLPYVIVAGKRYIRPADFQQMIESQERNAPPRRAGRPRIVA